MHICFCAGDPCMCAVIYHKREEAIYAQLFQPGEGRKPWISFIPIYPVHLETKDCIDCRTVKELLWSCCVTLRFLDYEENFHGRHGMIYPSKVAQKIWNSEKKISSYCVYIYCYIWMFYFTVFTFSVCTHVCLFVCVCFEYLTWAQTLFFLSSYSRQNQCGKVKAHASFCHSLYIYVYTCLFKYVHIPKFLIRILSQEF